MLRRWLSSACVYVFGESTGACLDDRTLSLDRIATVATFGATADAVALRAFHVAVETRLPSPLFRMLAEQVMYAPFSNTAYLTMAKKTDWTFDDFTRLYSRDCSFWSVASYVGYRYVPLRIRYLYVSGATLCWNTWRSSLVT